MKSYYKILIVKKYSKKKRKNQISWKIEIKYLYYIMGCSSCKQKRDIKKDLLESTESVNKGVIWFVIVWSLFAVYGIYSLIKNFL